MKAPVVGLLFLTSFASAETPTEIATKIFRAGIPRRLADADAHFAAVRGSDNETQWARIVERAQREGESQGANQSANLHASARATSLEANNASAITQLAEVALKTDVDGAEAGIAFAPLALAGLRQPAARAWNLTIAALEEDQFRIGTAFRIDLDPLGLGPDEIGLAPCKFDRDAYGTELDHRADDYAAVCIAISGIPLPDTAGYPDPAKRSAAQREWLKAAVLCGRDASDALQNLDSGELQARGQMATDVNDGPLISKVAGLLKYTNAVKAASTTNVASQQAIAMAAPAIAQLQPVLDTLPSRTSCLSKGTIAARVIQQRWAQRDRAIGLSGHVDFFPRKFGFNPDETKALPSGEVAKAEARAELLWSFGRLAVTGGVGGRISRDDGDADFTKEITPSVGFEYIAFRLDGGDIVEDGKLALTSDNDVPPLVVVGVDVHAAIAMNKPDSQKTRFDEVGIAAFADFRISESLAFRVGVPVRAEIVTREADTAAMPAVTEKKALQWTIPVFVTTVIKL